MNGSNGSNGSDGDAAAGPDPFAPAHLGPIELRNRILKAATFQGMSPEALVTDELIAVVNDRAKQLTRFQLLKDRFTRTGEISRVIALDVADSLVQLGRL